MARRRRRGAQRARPGRAQRRRGDPARRPLSSAASTSAAGSATSTPTSDTERSTSVTRPKSRSIAMSESASTPNPAIAVTPRRPRRRPCAGRRAAAPPPCRGRPARSWRWRSDSSTLNSVEIAITSAPSVTDIGFSGTRSANSTSADQPRGEHDRHERHQRAAAVAPEGDQQDQGDGRERSEQRDDPPPRRGDLSAGLGGEHRQPDEPGADPRGGMQARAHPFDHPLLLLEGHQADAERERGRAAVGGDHVLGEVGRDRVEQAADLAASVSALRLACRLFRPPHANRSGSEKAGHSCARPQPLAAL